MSKITVNREKQKLGRYAEVSRGPCSCRATSPISSRESLDELVLAGVGGWTDPNPTDRLHRLLRADHNTSSLGVGAPARFDHLLATFLLTRQEIKILPIEFPSYHLFSSSKRFVKILGV